MLCAGARWPWRRRPRRQAEERVEQAEEENGFAHSSRGELVEGAPLSAIVRLPAKADVGRQQLLVREGSHD